MIKIDGIAYDADLTVEPTWVTAHLDTQESLAELASKFDNSQILENVEGEEVSARYYLRGISSMEKRSESGLTLVTWCYSKYEEKTAEEISESLSNNADELSDILDALTELGDIVSNLVNGE